MYNQGRSGSSNFFGREWLLLHCQNITMICHFVILFIRNKKIDCVCYNYIIVTLATAVFH